MKHAAIHRSLAIVATVTLGLGLAIASASPASADDATFAITNLTATPLRLVSKTKANDTNWATQGHIVGSILATDKTQPHRFNTVRWWGQDNRSTVIYSMDTYGISFVVHMDPGSWTYSPSSTCTLFGPHAQLGFACYANGTEIKIWASNASYSVINSSNRALVLEGGTPSIPGPTGDRTEYGTTLDVAAPWDLTFDQGTWAIWDDDLHISTGDRLVVNFERNLNTEQRWATCRVFSARLMPSSLCFTKSPGVVQVAPLRTYPCRWPKTEFDIRVKTPLPAVYRTALAEAIAEYARVSAIKFTVNKSAPGPQSIGLTMLDLSAHSADPRKEAPGITHWDCDDGQPSADIYLNDKPGGPPSGMTNPDYLRLLVMHELGHALGLDHTLDAFPSIMLDTVDKIWAATGHTGSTTFTPYDLEALAALYPQSMNPRVPLIQSR